MYSARLMELFHTRVHGGDLADPTHAADAGVPGQGPYIRFAFRAHDGVVETARWKTYGCPAAMACAEAACEWSEGRSLAELSSATPDLVTEWVGGVPEGKEHCPALAAQGLCAVQPVP